MSAFKSLGVAEARRFIEAGDCVVIDVRLPFNFHGGRISGALNLPGKSMQSRKNIVPSDRRLLIVADDDAQAEDACALAQRLGFVDVVRLEGGMDAWLDADLPVDTISDGL